MKERGFGHDTEHTVAQLPGIARGATVTKLHRPAKTEKLNVDELVTDFLQALETYAARTEALETLDFETPERSTPQPEAAGDLPQTSAPPIGPEVTSAEAITPDEDVDAELNLTLYEIESLPRLSVIPSPAREIIETQPASPVTSEPTPTPEAAAHLPDQAAEIKVAKYEAPLEAASVPEARIVVEPKSTTGLSARQLPLTSPSYSHSSNRRVVIGFAAVVVTAAICFAVYFFFLGKPAPRENSSGAALPGAASAAGTTQRQAAQDAVAPEAGAPAAGGSAAMTEPGSLTSPAEPIFRVAPTYPRSALQLWMTGTVGVRVSIDEQGRVTKAIAVSGHEVLRPAAEDAVMKWIFKPAMQRGVAVKSELVVSVNFVR